MCFKFLVVNRNLCSSLLLSIWQWDYHLIGLSVFCKRVLLSPMRRESGIYYHYYFFLSSLIQTKGFWINNCHHIYLINRAMSFWDKCPIWNGLLHISLICRVTGWWHGYKQLPWGQYEDPSQQFLLIAPPPASLFGATAGARILLLSVYHLHLQCHHLWELCSSDIH